ncbi:hypothetical protein CEXT_188881 [Caerostris extrusa]|uniref:Uncharacterized protein n=1 Tax=Caerostris extrusa TaxID=172846 RepID=A0AAV4NR15_CAEEX|nr:hypothetical protein CEXT_188881 [Caerostris extrusa]
MDRGCCNLETPGLETVPLCASIAENGHEDCLQKGDRSARVERELLAIALEASTGHALLSGSRALRIQIIIRSSACHLKRSPWVSFTTSLYLSLRTECEPHRFREVDSGITLGGESENLHHLFCQSCDRPWILTRKRFVHIKPPNE